MQNNSEFDQSINSKPMIAFFCIFGFFVSGLVVNTVIAGKLVSIGSLIVPASVFVWALTYPICDIVTEIYGPQTCRKMLLGGFIALIAMFIYFAAAVSMTPAPFWEGQDHFERFFGISNRVTIAVLISYAITQYIDIKIFTTIKDKTGLPHLWLRSAISTIVAQTAANIIFAVVVFAGALKIEDWLTLFWGNLTMRYILVISDTLIVYAGVSFLYKMMPELKRITDKS